MYRVRWKAQGEARTPNEMGHVGHDYCKRKRKENQTNVQILSFSWMEGWMSGRMLALNGGEGLRVMRVFRRKMLFILALSHHG